MYVGLNMDGDEEGDKRTEGDIAADGAPETEQMDEEEEAEVGLEQPEEAEEGNDGETALTPPAGYNDEEDENGPPEEGAIATEEEEEEIPPGGTLPTTREEEEEGEIDYNLGIKPFGDYRMHTSYRMMEIEGEGRYDEEDLEEYAPEDQEFAGEGDSTGIQMAASFSELDALIKALEGDKCEDGAAGLDSNQATMGSTMKETSDGQGTSMANAEEEKKQDEDTVIVLGPDHPRMQRFQKALKEHLNRQIYNMDCEIRDMVMSAAELPLSVPGVLFLC